MSTTEFTMSAQDESDKNVIQWKMKQLIKGLQLARGNGTSMISLIIPPRYKVARVQKMLTEELGTANNIKSRVNRQSVVTAISSVQSRLKLYTNIPEKGLVIYCGTVQTEEGKEKLVNFDLEPFKPIHTPMYYCDNKFHTEPLQDLLSEDRKIGFIVIDGSGCLFGLVQGGNREIIHKFSVDLPKKHGRGGQSALRFSRLRTEKRHNYLRKVAETATEIFIKADNVSVHGLILAGSADLKTELSQSDMFDLRLREKIVKIVDIAYGGENGFKQAIDLSACALHDMKFVQEMQILRNYYEEIRQDFGKYVFGVRDTLKALEAGVVETLICYENLDFKRYQLRNALGEHETVIVSSKDSDLMNNFSVNGSTEGVEIVEVVPLMEWIVNNYKRVGAQLETVSNKTPEGTQFECGFGGIGAILRYQIDLEEPECDNELLDINFDEY